MKVRYFMRCLERLERLTEELGKTEFAAILTAMGRAQVSTISPVVEAIKQTYLDNIRGILRELQAKTKCIEYVTMKELKNYFSDLEKTVHRKMQLFVAQQIELFKFANINSEESDSSGDPPKHSSSDPSSIHKQELLQKQNRDLDSNYSSINSSDQRTARSKNDRSLKPAPTYRKLPRSASKILNQWITDHMGDPYPTQEEKVLLASRTRLSLRQITNWFVNHRGRKLKKFKNYGTFAEQIKSKLLVSNKRR